MRRAITIKEAKELANNITKDAEQRRIDSAGREAEEHARIVQELRDERGPIQPTDTQILDFLADERIFDGYGGVDIDEATTQALINSGADPDNEDVWDRESKLEWRRQFRLAITKGMQK